VGSAIHYPTILPCQPLFAPRPESAAAAESAFPNAFQAAGEVLCLPCFPELTDGEVDRVAAAVRHALAHLV
jgi:dTDP-4-amino-4,6-dideoxygalactose transaminase